MGTLVLLTFSNMPKIIIYNQKISQLNSLATSLKRSNVDRMQTISEFISSNHYLSTKHSDPATKKTDIEKRFCVYTLKME